VKRFIVFVIGLTFLGIHFSSCQGGGCEMMYPCTAINFGTYIPNDSTKNWLPTKIDSIKLINSNGYISNLIFAIYENTTEREISYRNEPDGGDCGRTQDCSDYYYLGRKGWQYASVDLGLNFMVFRMPSMSVTQTLHYKPSPSEVYSLGDILLAQIGSNYFVTTYTEGIFIQSLILNGIRFNSVYEIPYSKNASGIYPAKAYFSKNLGLIGYVLSNGEVWCLDIK